MDDRESTRRTPSHAARAQRQAAGTPAGDTGSTPSFNEDLLSGTGSIPLAASAPVSAPDGPTAEGDPSPGRATLAQDAPRYVRKRAPHRSQGTLNDLSEDNEPTIEYTHDSNVSVGGATPLSGMSYRRARSNVSRMKNSSRYGQYLEIPKGRRSIFASRERARRRNSVLALLGVVLLLVLAAMFLWNMMQNILG